MDTMTQREQLAGLHGRLVGLAGTTRYDVPIAMREELWEMAETLADAMGFTTFRRPKPEPHP